ncbi:spindle and centriole-associated protein 1 isoform X2 [Gouania willdenowi]|uniref:Spindle and centriole-associated protein 1 n=1 Tax=Gouania willdenowi TaxID=441366 RepID=A0A8C5DTT7_GOUWI|nr:spindle and centriole-associated protein 1 isoform X2 [Gouania willdenowi]
MSSVRVLKSQQHNKGKKTVRPKKSATKRDWVSTVNDLSVYKPTPAELSHRHEMHKSHNKAAAQWELREKALKQQLRHVVSPAPFDKASISIIREVFSDQLLLQDVLARSDRAMAVVKDLFGDAPRRQTGHPSVTIAPNFDSDSDLPVLQRPDPPTQLSLLSQSLMDQEALNELEGSDDDHEDSHPSQSSGYHVVRRSNNSKVKAQSSHSNSNQRLRNSINVTPSTSRGAPHQAALNATGAVRRVRSKLNLPENERNETPPPVTQVLNPELSINQKGAKNIHHIKRSQRFASQSSELNGSSTVTGDQSSLGVLQAMLGQVEADLDALSADTAPASSQSPNQHSKHKQQGLTGFSVALISTLGRLVHLVKQKEDVAQKEVEERKKLEAAVTEQRGLIDALTAETMELRDEAAVLRAGFQQHTAELEEKLDAVVLVMGALGLLGDRNDTPQGSEVSAAVSPPMHVAAPVSEATRVNGSPAVLFSSPPLTNNAQQNSGKHPVLLHLQPPGNSHSSVFSLSSVPLTGPSSTSPSLSSHLSLDATLAAEIAQLNTQNELIRAQLNQANGTGSGIGAPPSRSSDKAERASALTQSAGERRTSSRRVQNCKSPVEGANAQSQQTSPNTLSVHSVEQRLLELNRQSAAARSRLMELIEHQKQKVSPSASPSRPSEFSPNTADQPEPGRWPHSERRSRGSDASSRGSGRETEETNSQVDGRRQREGWFALSAHVR